MTYDVDISGHSVWDQTETLRQLCASTDGWPDRPDVREALARVLWTMEQIKARRENTPIQGLARTSLNNIGGHLSNLHAHVNGTLQGQNYDLQIHQYCDSIQTEMAGWFPARPARAVSAVIEASDAYKKAAESAVAGLEKSLGELEAKVDGFKANLDATMSSGQTRASEALESMRGEIDRLTLVAQEQTSRLDTQLNSLSATFQDAESSRAKEALAAREEANQEYQDALQQMNDQSVKFLKDLQVKSEQANNILEKMGVVATTSEYSAYAEQERRAGHLWNGMAVAVGLVGAATLGWALRSVTTTDAVSWQLITLKAAVSTVLVVVAGYCGRQAAGHRVQERQAKSFALALSVMEPYLANVDPADARQLRGLFVSRLISGHSDRDEDRRTGEAGSFLSSFAKNQSDAE